MKQNSIFRFVLRNSRFLSDMAKVRPIVISGPSGGGKSTLLKMLFAEYPGCFEFSVSHTTRNPRPGETNGKDYHFVTRDEFKKLVDEGGFLEHAEFSGNRYGTSKMAVEQVQSTGKICVLDVEINGVKSIKMTDLNARFIFVQPPSMDELKRRLEGRKTESAESLQRRLDTASEALAYAQEDGAYDNKIINDDLDKAYCKLKEALSEYFSHIVAAGAPNHGFLVFLTPVLPQHPLQAPSCSSHDIQRIQTEK